MKASNSVKPNIAMPFETPLFTRSIEDAASRPSENPGSLPAPTLAERVRFALLAPRTFALRMAGASYETFVSCIGQLAPDFLAREGDLRARQAFYRALRDVPAYRNFIATHASPANAVPETDKANYIDAYPIAARCVNGCIPAHDVAIDESSGSTGTPYNWVRSGAERRHNHRFVSYFVRYLYGAGPRIVVNAFSMGAWSTGINTAIALERNGIVKSTGPDAPKVLETLRAFGPGQPYLIVGYPPFLKRLIDIAEAERFPLKDYRLDALVGGEGMTEGLRDYLLRVCRKVYSGYGATDLEIGLAGETPLSVAIRRLALRDHVLRSELFGDDPRLPMLFQHIPLVHHIETNRNGELLVTITRLDLLCPRIRYNVHDQGGVARYDEMAATLGRRGIDIDALAARGGARGLRLPFVWIHGRRDYTVSVMGANIYPEDIEHCLYSEPDIARATRSFCLSTAQGPGGEQRPLFLFEVEVEPTPDFAQRVAAAIGSRLRALNADFRAASAEYPEIMEPEIRLYRVGDGPFAQDARRIKQTRVLRRA